MLPKALTLFPARLRFVMVILQAAPETNSSILLSSALKSLSALMLLMQSTEDKAFPSS